MARARHRGGSAGMALLAGLAAPGVLAGGGVAEGERRARSGVAARAVAGVMCLRRLVARPAVRTRAGVGKRPALAWLLVAVGAHAGAVSGRGLVAVLALLTGLVRIHPRGAWFVVAREAVGIVRVTVRPFVALGAVHAALGVDELELPSGPVAQQAVAPRLVLGGMAPSASGQGEVVAVRATNRDVSGDVRRSRADCSDRPGGNRRDGAGLVDTGRLECRGSDLMPCLGVAVCAGACLHVPGV